MESASSNLRARTLAKILTSVFNNEMGLYDTFFRVFLGSNSDTGLAEHQWESTLLKGFRTKASFGLVQSFSTKTFIARMHKTAINTIKKRNHKGERKKERPWPVKPHPWILGS